MTGPAPLQDQVNILLVDDQPSKLLSYEVILRDLGENLIKTGSAREALGVLLKTDVALILIDVCMPELDGFELAALIRDHPRYRKIPIIFVSAIQVTDIDRLRGYEAGAVDYVPVPVVPELLRAKCRVFAELHRKSRELERVNDDLEARVRERTAALEASSRQLRELNQELEQRIDERTQERETALAQLFEAQKMETIGQLTGGIAHDFNNLLMAVLGSLELLKKRLPDDDARTSRLIDTAIQGAERGAALTQRLLAFSRRQELRPEAVDVSRLIDGMEDLLVRAIGPGVQIHKSLSTDLPLAQVDGNQLELALLNIAVNARDAMATGGSLTISGTRETIGGIHTYQKLTPGEYVRLSIVDTGAGMDAKTLAKASEPFFTTKGVGKGTGLGLSMVHGLAAQSGGALEISSELGKGTTVDIWLPQATADAFVPAEYSAPSPKATPLTTCVVLVVDDDPLVTTGTVAMLEDLGHTAREAASAAEALKLLETCPRPDLVVTDHAMPGMTGHDLALQLQTRYPGLPVIIATGYADLAECEKPLGFLRLSKPFKQAELSAAMVEALGASFAKNVVALKPPIRARKTN